jgi:HSP20 family protein
VKEENRNYIHRERRVSSMVRSIYLPDAKSEGVKARLDNGVLNITVVKRENAAPRTNRIEIQ